MISQKLPYPELRLSKCHSELTPLALFDMKINEKDISSKILLKRIYRREYITMGLGFVIPLLLDVAHYFWLYRYVSKGAIRALLIVAFGLVGGVFVYLIANMKSKQLKKYIPVEMPITEATIARLKTLDNPDAWREFHSAYYWRNLAVFFYCLWLGSAASAFFEYSIYPLYK